MNGPINSRYAVGPFVAGAPLLLIGALFLFGVSKSTVADVIGIVLILAGLALLVLSIVMFRKLSAWNQLRKGSWTKLAVLMVVDDAYGEQEKTLLDTLDGVYRIALARYPLELRDEIEMTNEIEYVGELADGKPILLRPVGGGLEYFAVARELAKLSKDGK